MNSAPASWNALQAQFDAHGAVQVSDLPATPERVGAAHLDLMLLRTEDDGTLLAIPEGVTPPPDSPLRLALDQAPTQDGWRLVSVIPGTSVRNAWEAYQALFVSAVAPPGGHEPPRRDPRCGPQEQPLPADPSPAPPFCRDLTAAAHAGELPRAIGRDTEVAQLIEALGGKIKRSACLVGEPGVGKTAVVEELAHHIALGDTPSHLKDAGLWQLDLSQMLGGTARHGDVEQRVGGLCEALLSRAPERPQPVLFIDELHTTATGRGDLPLTELLKPHLSRGLRVIGATTHADWAEHIEPDRALVRRFQRIVVNPPDAPTTLRIIQARLPELEAHHGLRASGGTLRSIVDLSDRWLWGRSQPDKALDLLDAAMSHQAHDCPGEALSDDAVSETLARMAGLDPADLHRAEDPQALLAGIETALQERIIGQPHALQPLLDAFRSRLLRGLEDRPQVCLLFAGPSGVGKTETAVQLAKAYAGTEEALVRIDGSEFCEPHTVARLIGSPPGYVGYGEGGQLTEAVKRRPRCVVLFDEVEKAAPSVHHLLLQVMSAGRLTDGTGDTVDFRHACVILTSNLGNTRDAGAVADDAADPASILRAVRAALPVELLGRLDAIVPFRRLSVENLERIADLRLADLAERIPGLASLAAESDARRWLAQRAWSPDYGARELERVLRSEVEPLLAEVLWQREKGAAPQALRLTVHEQGGSLTLMEEPAGGEDDG